MVLVAAVAAVGIAVSPRLRSEVAVHFWATGQPDNYVPRLISVALAPAIALGTLAVVRGAARFDPPNDPRSMDAVVLGTTGLVAAVHLLVLGSNPGTGCRCRLSPPRCCRTLGLAGYLVLRESP